MEFRYSSLCLKQLSPECQHPTISEDEVYIKIPGRPGERLSDVSIYRMPKDKRAIAFLLVEQSKIFIKKPGG